MARYSEREPLKLDSNNLIADAYAYYLDSSEKFLIDGDALAVYAFENSLLDWSYGGQILHAVYLMENTLNVMVSLHSEVH